MTEWRPPLPPGGWHDDPDDPASLRYWDGARWTDHQAPKQPSATSRSGEQRVPLHRVISPFVKLPAKDAADKAGAVANDLADKAGSAASGVADVAGDVADKVAGAAEWLVRLPKRIVLIVLFPLWFALLLFGCGPLS